MSLRMPRSLMLLMPQQDSYADQLLPLACLLLQSTSLITAEGSAGTSTDTTPTGGVGNSVGGVATDASSNLKQEEQRHKNTLLKLTQQV